MAQLRSYGSGEAAVSFESLRGGGKELKKRKGKKRFNIEEGINDIK